MNRAIGGKCHVLLVVALITLAVLAGSSSRAARVNAAKPSAPLAVPGPGVPAITFSSSELFTPLSRFNSATRNAPGFHGFSFMHDGYMILMRSGSCCSGGGFNVYNISNPRNPVLVKRVDRASQREGHTVGSSYFNGKKYIVALATTGINFWDLTDAANPILVKEMSLPNITGSDYDTGAWWLAWQAPYVYVSGSSRGLYIVDASNPASPVLKKTISNATLGTNFRAGTIFVVGNVMTITMNDKNGFATFDISDPLNPRLRARNTTAVARQYGSLLNGNKLYLMAKDSSNPTSGVVTFDINNLSSPTRIASLSFGNGGGYALFQDGFLMEGASAPQNGPYKVDVRTNSYSVVGHGPSNSGLRDPDFVGVFGNLIMTSDDDGDGSILMAHATNPDTSPPAVNMVSPKNGATNVSATSRVGVTLTDQPDLRSVNSTTFIVRPVGSSTALGGKYSGEQGVLNFWPDTSLAGGTQYEVIINGVKDFAGNTMTTQFRSTFTTAGGVTPTPVTSTPTSTPTVTPTPIPPSNRHEAENATISQGVVESNHAGFSGSGFVNYNNVIGSYVEWTVNATQAGNATLAIRFANGTTTNRPMDISVNGTVVASGVAFNGTGAWSTWQTNSVIAPLNAGTNVIRASATTANGGPNVDYLEVP